MPTESSNEWLLEAVNALGERFLVVSPEFEILAVNFPDAVQTPALGKKCHEYFYGFSSPCNDCVVKIAMETAEPVSRSRPEPERSVVQIADLYPEGVARRIMRTLREGKGYLRSHVVDVIAEDGQVIPISLNAAIVYDDKREIATIGYFHDMREELRMREKLERTRVQLLQAEKLVSIGLLATGVAHEINNPVAIMIEESGWIEDLLEEDEFRESRNLEEFNRALKQIHTQGQRCKEITRKLLSFARKRDSGEDPTDLNRAIEDVAGLCQQRARQNNVILETRLEDSLPRVRVSASEMQQVLMNLINNSLDALADSGGTICLSSRRTRDQVLVKVADNGPGISQADQAKVFDPFFTTKSVGKGSGLGLFICYSLIKSMGGRIAVHSEPESRTRFTIRLPIQSPTDKRQI